MRRMENYLICIVRGMNTKRTAQALDISRRTCHRLRQECEATGLIRRKKPGSFKYELTEKGQEAIRCPNCKMLLPAVWMEV